MRGDKTVARILLIFSITNAVLTAPVVMVAPRSPVTDGPDDKSMDGSSPSLASDSGYLPDNDAPASRVLPSTDPPPYLSDDDDLSNTKHSLTGFSQISPDPYYLHSLSDLHSHGSDRPYDSLPWNQGSPAASVTDSFESDSVESKLNDLPPILGAPPSQDNPPPASEAARLHDNPTLGPEAAQLHDDSLPWWHNHWDPLDATEHVVSGLNELKLKGL